jgi:hypothetical protein
MTGKRATAVEAVGDHLLGCSGFELRKLRKLGELVGLEEFGELRRHQRHRRLPRVDRRRVGWLGLRTERVGERLRSKSEEDVLDPSKERQVGIGTRDLRRQLLPRLFGLRAHEASLPGRETQEYQLVVLAALELERAPVAAVGDDGLIDVGEWQRLMQAGGLDAGQIPDQPAEQALQIGHGILVERRSVGQFIEVQVSEFGASALFTPGFRCRGSPRKHGRPRKKTRRIKVLLFHCFSPCDSV